MNKEPENLTTEEQLRVENITLRREIVRLQDEALTRDIAAAHMLEVKECGKTWAVHEGRIVPIEAPAEVSG